MSFSFDETLPTDRDYVRFRLDDVDEADPRLSDELIDTLLDRFGLWGALLEGCNRIKLFYGKEPDVVGLTGGKRFQFARQYQAYAELYRELEAEYAASAGAEGGALIGSLPHDSDAETHYLPLLDFRP